MTAALFRKHCFKNMHNFNYALTHALFLMKKNLTARAGAVNYSFSLSQCSPFLASTAPAQVPELCVFGTRWVQSRNSLVLVVRSFLCLPWQNKKGLWEQRVLSALHHSPVTSAPEGLPHCSAPWGARLGCATRGAKCLVGDPPVLLLSGCWELCSWLDVLSCCSTPEMTVNVF